VAARRKTRSAGGKKPRETAKSTPEPVYTGTPDALAAEQIARKLQEISALLEILGENPFKVRAYENAARVLPGLGDELAAAIESGELERVRGIGRGIADKVVALAYTGESEYYDELKSRVPPGLLELLRIPGLGPKKVKLLFDSMDIASVEALEAACQSDALKDMRGFGEKTQQNILRGIAYLRRVSARFFWSVAHEHASAAFESLRAHPATTRTELAGSLRRRKETVHDVDIVVSTEDPESITQHFASGDWAERVIGSGPTKTSILHPSGLQIDLRVVSDEQYPYALHHFTGSKMHNVAMRGRAQRMGIKINEYGLFRGEELIPCKTEEEIFAALGLQYVPPELREDEGEIEAAESKTLPTRLLERADVLGAFHVHVDAAGGVDDLEVLVRAARDLGWQYIGLSQSGRAAGGRAPSSEHVAERRAAIRAVAQRVAGIRIFHGIESSIREDGSLADPDDVLRSFDFVIAAVHEAGELRREAQTRRLLRAVENPRASILGHPTNRQLLDRPGLDVDLAAVFEAAARAGVVVQINGRPERMDPDGSQIRMARNKGALLCVDPEAHDAADLRNVDLAVGLARRGWLGPEHVLNTWSAERVARHFESRDESRGSRRQDA
jgi:DNA polymerase (family 10)